MANRFFTILVVPEKTSKIRKLIIPSWILKGGILSLIFTGVLAGIMVLDYWFVMNQIEENKELKRIIADLTIELKKSELELEGEDL